jgi:hypothetical protein
MAKDDRDRWWVFKVPKISVWWLVWTAMLGGYIYYQYGYVKNSEHSEQKTEQKKYAILDHEFQNNPLENGRGASQLSRTAKNIIGGQPLTTPGALGSVGKTTSKEPYHGRIEQ